MPDLVLQVASEPGLDEPMWCWLETGSAPEEWPPSRMQPMNHPAGLQRLTSVTLAGPSVSQGSVTLRMAALGLLSLEAAEGYGLRLEFDGGSQGRQQDFRPELPLVCRW